MAGTTHSIMHNEKRRFDLLTRKFNSIKIPTEYIFVHGKELYVINVLKYTHAICLTNKLNMALIGKPVDHLRTVSVRFSTKTINLFPNLSIEYVIDPTGVNVFGYIFDTRNGYINVTHLEEKYNLDFTEWEKNNTSLLDVYCRATGLSTSKLIIKGNNIYVLPRLCVSFICATKPEYGHLMKTMSNLLVGKLTSK